MHYCDSCSKKFKNGASLSQHKYKYHPYSKNALDNKFQESDSNESQSVDLNESYQIRKSKYNYKYHPYSKNIEDNKFSDHSDEGSSVDKSDHMQIINNKTDVKLLNDDVNELRKIVDDLDVKMMCSDYTKKMVGAGSIIVDNNNYKEDMETVKDRSVSNKQMISAIENKLEDLYETTQEDNNVVAEDLIYDTEKFKKLFANNQYETLLSKIPELRLVANFW